MKLLVDENISPRTTEFLKDKGHDVKTVRDSSIGASDKEIVEMAKKEERCIVTQDTDFGEIYYFSNEEELKIAVVKTSRQKVSVVNEILEEHLSRLEDQEFGLFIIREGHVRELK